jgi:hypothetical protein
MQKIVFLSCGTEIHFSKKKFLAGASIIFFSATMKNLRKSQAPPDKKMLVALY